MAKAASKYISFDTAGNFVSELADGPAVPVLTEDGSLQSAVSYALDAIVEAAGTLPDTAAALVGARAGATHRDPEEKVADVSEHVRSTIARRLRRKCRRRRAPSPVALVIASAKNARAPSCSARGARRASTSPAPRWTTARWTASLGACCPRTAWAAPRLMWTPTRFPPTATRRALGGQGLRRSARLPRQRQGAARRGRLFPAPRCQARSARVRSGHRGHLAYRLGGAFARRQHDGALRGALGVGAGASAACRRR